MNRRWIEGNDIRLLENGEEFFPRVFACIANATQEVVLETFILFEDKVGLQLHAGAGRGGAARRADRHDHRRLRLARPVGRLHRLARRGGRAHPCVRPRQAPAGLAHQRAATHAPQDRGGRRRRRLRRRHQLLGRPPGRLRARGQAGLFGGDPRAAGGRDPPLHPRGAGPGPALPARAASGGAGAAACARSRGQPAACRHAPPPCWWCATTASTRATSSGTTASPSARRASA